MARREVVLACSIWLYWFSLYTYVPILPTYAKDLGASYQMIGAILGSYGFTQMLLRLPLGVVSDRINRRKVFIVAGAVMCVASSLGMWLARDPAALLFFRLLSGVAATVWVVQSVLFAGYYPPGEGAKAMGRITAVVNFGEMTGMLSGGVAAHLWGVEQAFLAGAVAGSVALGFSFLVRENALPGGAEPVRAAEVFAMVRTRSLFMAAALGLLLLVLTFGTAFGFVPLVAKQLGASYVEIGLLPCVFMLPGIAASTVSGTFFLRLFGGRTLLAAGFLGMALPCAATPFITDIQTLFVSQAIAGFARGLAFPLLMALSIRDCPAGRRATAMGVFQAAYGLGMLLGPLTVGRLGQTVGLDWGFWVLGAVGALGALTAFTGLPARPGTRETGSAA